MLATQTSTWTSQAQQRLSTNCRGPIFKVDTRKLSKAGGAEQLRRALEESSAPTEGIQSRGLPSLKSICQGAVLFPSDERGDDDQLQAASALVDLLVRYVPDNTDTAIMMVQIRRGHEIGVRIRPLSCSSAALVEGSDYCRFCMNAATNTGLHLRAAQLVSKMDAFVDFEFLSDGNPASQKCIDEAEDLDYVRAGYGDMLMQFLAIDDPSMLWKKLNNTVSKQK